LTHNRFFVSKLYSRVLGFVVLWVKWIPLCPPFLSVSKPIGIFLIDLSMVISLP
jgi:hypothetical protein